MKVTAAITILAAAANTAMAVPVAPREQAGLFEAINNVIHTGVGAAFDLAGAGVNTAAGLAGLAFNGATCTFISIFGVKRPSCGGRATLGNNGSITTTKENNNGNSNSNTNVNHNSDNNSFSFSYTTENDGRLKVTITPDAKGKSQCVTIVEKKGEIKEIVAREADKCL
ncbi:hypothetical protein N0V84_001697 [Fusarium piperis]|uniref:Uncharacterized protein n=1 Tax=Fusarium piperis TaxID=1435070 RepID=A0A9W8WKP5_9HYPO|nr:hypothetical protein N0V84_001697 [Fusarium piperis]